jgi:hypothetical protein
MAARPEIRYPDEHTVWSGLSGGDEYISHSVRDRAHGLDSVDHEIQVVSHGLTRGRCSLDQRGDPDKLAYETRVVEIVGPHFLRDPALSNHENTLRQRCDKV